jgi:hypothetical protein
MTTRLDIATLICANLAPIHGIGPHQKPTKQIVEVSFEYADAILEYSARTKPQIPAPAPGEKAS